MIKFYNQVPSVYPSASRDFQYLSWLIDIVLNSVKHNVDDLYDLPNSKADPKLTELLAMTLGFKVKRNYNQNQLKALVAALPRILKYKGTTSAVYMAGNALVAASGAAGAFSIIEKKTKDGELWVRFPENLVDISLFTDLLPYVLPAGMTCHIERVNQVERKHTTELSYRSAIQAAWIPDFDWNQNSQTSVGLSLIFNVGSDMTEFANYQRSTGIEDNRSLSERLNVGLLDNTIIPTLETPLYDKKSKDAIEDTGGTK